ncbi:MAG: glycosyltransferase [Bryobacteraceae bacterium]
MQTLKPSIAVITPVRNAMPFLPEAIRSIRDQSYAPLELIVVDDGSTDGSSEYVRSLEGIALRSLTTADAGPAAARNAAIRSSESDLVAFLDADDLWPSGTLHRMVEALAADPEAGFAQGLIRNFRDLSDGSRHFFTAPYRYLNLGACLWRRSTLTEVGLLDADLRLCEDLDLMLRCWERDIPKAEIDEVTLHYRRHPGNMTAGLSGAGFGTLRAYQKRIDRIRYGKFQNTEPRRFVQSAYLGSGPVHQDGPYRSRPPKTDAG